MSKPKKLSKGDLISKTDIGDAVLIAYTKSGKPFGHFRCPVNHDTWVCKSGTKLHGQDEDDLMRELNVVLTRIGNPVYIYKHAPSSGVYAKVRMDDNDLKRILRRIKK